MIKKILGKLGFRSKTDLQYMDFQKEFNTLNELGAKVGKRFSLDWEDRYAILNEKTSTTSFERHYMYHTAWAARVLQQIKPEVHKDFSSSLFFNVISSAFVPIEFYDYRPAELILENFKTNHADLTKLDFEDNSIKSLSCMHVVEHIGLGRYGDELDYNGDLKAIKELARVLTPDGDLLFVVPVGGKAKIMFNAHRIYQPKQIIKLFQAEGLVLKEFTMIPEEAEDGALVQNPVQKLIDKQEYACGCFWFSKT
jgi:hypothetical protein